MSVVLKRSVWALTHLPMATEAKFSRRAIYDRVDSAETFVDLLDRGTVGSLAYNKLLI